MTDEIKKRVAEIRITYGEHFSAHPDVTWLCDSLITALEHMEYTIQFSTGHDTTLRAVCKSANEAITKISHGHFESGGGEQNE